MKTVIIKLKNGNELKIDELLYNLLIGELERIEIKEDIMEDTSYVSLSLNKYNELYDKAKKYDEGNKNTFEFTDETGYVLITEIIKAHIADHNDNNEVMRNCSQALQILEMLKDR